MTSLVLYTSVETQIFRILLRMTSATGCRYENFLVKRDTTEPQTIYVYKANGRDSQAISVIIRYDFVLCKNVVYFLQLHVEWYITLPWFSGTEESADKMRRTFDQNLTHKHKHTEAKNQNIKEQGAHPRNLTRNNGRI